MRTKKAGSRLFIDRLDGSCLEKLRMGLSFINFGRLVSRNDHIFIKPNLTLPDYRKGVMTSPVFLENVVIAIKDYTRKITIGESDGGGYTRFMMDEVYTKIGLPTIADRYGVRLVNLSKLPTSEVYFTYRGKLFSLPLPRMLLEQTELLVTVPVPKVHMHTGVSLSVKNQWGCISDPSVRLRLHPYFEKVITEVNNALRVRVSIIDGTYGLSGCGPLRGNPIALNWLLMADSIALADIACCALMRINPATVSHLQFYLQHASEGFSERIVTNRRLAGFCGPQFSLRIPLCEYPGHAAFRNSFLTWVAYFSPMASLLHRMKYVFADKYY